MSWRFRKTFKVLPGVKLNLTRHGLSATLGAAPFSVNVGPRGVYRNVSIPGTGLWNRERLDVPASHSLDIQPPINQGAVPPPFPYPTSASSSNISQSAEIHSASTELLNSDSMEQLRRILTDAYDERAVIGKEIENATWEVYTTRYRYEKWERGFLMKRLRKQTFATRKEAFDTAVAKLEELHEQLRQTTLATEITIDQQQAEPYYRMRDEFAALSSCQKIWSVLTEQVIDRIKERSTANAAITRDPVLFSLDSCDLIQWEQKVPHLPNRTGGDMYIFPGFVLYRASKQAFALIDFREVTLKFVNTHFTEGDVIPSDTQIIGHTWAKANKDGSPDRRFSGNYQIPVVHYGTLLFSTPDGLDVRYLCSNAALADRCGKAWAAFHDSLNPERSDGPQNEIEAFANASFNSGRSVEMQSEIETFTIAIETSKAICEDCVQNLNDNWNDGKGEILQMDLLTYMAALVKLISASQRIEQSGLPPTMKATIGQTIRDLEDKAKGIASLLGVEYEQWRTNPEAFNTLVKHAQAFIKELTEALETLRSR
jgi:Protein of unknown function (DUF4236)